MKALKWIAIGLVGLIVLVVGGVFVALSSIDPNQYKPQIVEAARNATGRELALRGDIKLGIGFNPSFSIADVTLSNMAGGSRPEMVKVGRFEVQVALLPLLSKQVDVKRLVLLDTDVLLETDRQGRGNWEFAPAQPQAPRPAQQTQQTQPAAAGGAMPLPVVREVELRNVRFAFRDGQKNQTVSAALEKVLLNADSAASPLKLDVAGSADAAPLGELKFALAGTICSVERLLATSGSPCALDLTARLADALTARVRGGIVAPTQGRGLDIDLAVDVPDLVKLGQLLKQDIPAIGPVKIEAKLTDGAPQNRPSIPRLSVTAGAADTILVAIAGAIADPTNAAQRGVRLNVKADSRDLTGLFRALKQDAPVAGPLAFEATVAEPGPNRIDVTGLKLSVGRDNAVDLAGTINASLPAGNAKPSVTANLQSQQIDLVKLFPPKPAGQQAARPAAQPAQAARTQQPSDGRVIPNDRVPFDLLNAANANVTYRAGQIVLEPATLRNLNLQAVLNNGALAIRPLTVEVEGGRISVENTINAAQRAIAQKVEVRNLDIGRILASRQLSDWFRGGVTSFDLNLQGRGDTARAIAASLTGDVFLNVGQGELGQAAVRFVGEWLRSVAPGVAAVQIGTTVRCGIHKIDFRDGIGTYRAGLIETGIMNARTSGTINLTNEQLGLSQVVGPVGLRIGGTFANPSVGLDAAATGQALIQGAAGIVGGLAQGGAGAIGGLFGGGQQQPQQRPAASSDGCAQALAAATGRPAPAQAAPAQPQQPAPAQQAPAPSGGGLLPGGIPNPFRR
ncbi:MAG: AsmA family protein [Azospirillum sp.]|nr:AsmA family protein [Azospirillum sp.]